MQNLLDLIIVNIELIFNVSKHHLTNDNDGEEIKPIIDIESLATPNKNDNLKFISELYNDITLFEEESKTVF